MKKLSLLLIAVAFLCPNVANAQDGKGSINFVPYVGVNYSDFLGDPSYFFGKTSGKVNFMAGARFEFQIAEKFGIIADLNYRRLGATADKYRELRGYTVDYKKVTLDCITFGAQFKQKIVAGLSARAGVEGTFSVAEKRHYYYSGNDLYWDNEGNIIEGPFYDGYDKDDVGYIFSDHLNIAIPLGFTYDYKNFCVNATYHLPLTKCAEEDEYFLRNQALDFTIGYRLPLRKR